jgi:hypothetical protein
MEAENRTGTLLNFITHSIPFLYTVDSSNVPTLHMPISVIHWDGMRKK